MTAARTFHRPVFLFSFAVVALFCRPSAKALSQTPLFARGYTVIPEPQLVELKPDDFVLGNSWRVVLDQGVQRDDAAPEVLRADLASRYGIHLGTPTQSGSVFKTIRMTIRAGSVKIGSTTDRDRDKLAEEAYRLDLSPESIALTEDRTL